MDILKNGVKIYEDSDWRIELTLDYNIKIFCYDNGKCIDVLELSKEVFTKHLTDKIKKVLYSEGENEYIVKIIDKYDAEVINKLIKGNCIGEWDCKC